MAALYLVSTPIGNLGDITYRAVEVLSSVARILAEDTRRTATLLRRYDIKTPLVSAHAHNEAAMAQRLETWLDAGEDVALVSDAGTPLVSDPGARIVHRLLDAGHTVVPVPGASAVLSALVASGLDPEPFTFYGFLPRRGRERTDRLEAIAGSSHTTVVYEAPRRLVKSLRELEERCGSGRQVAVAREMTKIYETFVRGTLGEVLAYYQHETPRGEFVIVLAGLDESPGAQATAAVNEAARELTDELLAAGRRPSDVARELTRRLGVPRNRAYDLALSLSREDGGKQH